MRPAPLSLALVGLALLLGSVAPAAAVVDVGPVRASYEVYRADGSPAGEFAPGEVGAVSFTFAVRSGDDATYEVALVPSGRDPATSSSRAPVNATAPASLEAPFPVPGNATGTFRASFDVVVDRVEETNGTANATRVALQTVEVAVTVAAPVPPAAPFPWLLVAAGGAVLVGGAVAAARFRKRQVKAAPRSRTLQELTVEDMARKARPRDAAEVAAERAAVEAREAERLAKRESSIVDAKRRDLEKGIDLARTRWERGEITEFQYRKLKEQKEKQLADLDRSP